MKTYIKRLIESEAKSLFKEYPMVTIVGPRQSGKTTLVKQLFPKLPYVNLEKPDIREMAENDPNSFLQRYESGAVLDEIQRVPKLLSYLQVLVDEKNRNSMFILTGSHQGKLKEVITQSLAGRTAILKLLPFSLRELYGKQNQPDLNQIMLSGFLPRIHSQKQDPLKAYRNYFQTYIERDLHQIINVKDLSLFENFMKLCAGRIGQLFDASSIANDVGVSYHTINSWLSVLESSHIIFRLQPYYENFNKRVVKASKLYFTEIGIATYLLGIEEKIQLDRHPLRGHLFENLVVMELVKERLNQGKEAGLYFFRDHRGNEVDVIYPRSDKLIPIEIKSAMTFTPKFIDTLRLFEKWAKTRVDKEYLVYSGKPMGKFKNVDVLNYFDVWKVV